MHVDFGGNILTNRYNSLKFRYFHHQIFSGKSIVKILRRQYCHATCGKITCSLKLALYWYVKTFNM